MECNHPVTGNVTQKEAEDLMFSITSHESLSRP